MSPFSPRLKGSVASLGETRLIAAIQRWLGDVSPRTPFGIGDDCAVLAPPRSRGLVTVDPVVYGRHFDAKAPARAVGEKLLKRNLSDIAAMGGRPLAAVVALTLDRRTRLDWVQGFYRGLAVIARRHDVKIVGGDVAQMDGALAASLTLIGEATGPRVLTRHGARVGDWIYVTGHLGDSLRSGHHFKFTPRLAEGRWLAGQPLVRSMMDLSDGLAKDVRALTPPGSLPALDPEAIPCRGHAPIRSALEDGEDYELLFTLAKPAHRVRFAAAWRRAFPRVRLTCIGRFVPKDAFPPGAVDLQEFHGYEHLR
jgi:thiamine-monophosphate kinase